MAVILAGVELSGYRTSGVGGNGAMVPCSHRGWARSRAQTSAHQAVVLAGTGMAGGVSEELGHGGRSPGEARAVATACVRES